MADLIKVSYQITGVSQVEQALREFGPKLARRALRKSLQAAVNVLGNEVKDRTPIRTGLTKESVGTAVSISGNQQAGAGVVGFGKRGYKARMVEFGHRQVTHKPGKKEVGHVPAQPFIRPAFDASAERAIEAFAETMTTSIQELGKNA